MSTEPEKRSLFFRFYLPAFLVLGIIVLFWGIGTYSRGKSTERKKQWIEKFEKLASEVDDESHGNLDKLRRLPMVYRDRVQPLDSVARRVNRALSGSQSEYGADPVLLFLSMSFDGVDGMWNEVPFFLISYGVNRELVGIESIDKLASYDQVANNDKLREHLAKVAVEFEGKESLLTLPDQELIRVANHHSRELRNGFAHMFQIVPPTEGQRITDSEDQNDWHLPIMADMEGHDPRDAKAVETAFNDLRRAWVARDKAGIGEAADRLMAATKKLDPLAMPTEDKVDGELSMNRLNPFTASSWLYIAASMVALFAWAFRVRPLRWIAILLGVLGMCLSLYGFYMRLTLGFGVAITNLYESMVAVSFTTMLICITLDLVRGSSFGIMVGGIGSFVVLALLDRYSVKFDSAIGGTIAVLANNIWVHIHVPVVMASYAGFFLSFLLSLVALPWTFMNPTAKDPELKDLLKTAEIATNVGTFLIFVGMVLGGIWAADSWGRFWGWDPKETWSAILFIYYVIIIHLRWVGFPKTINGVKKRVKMQPFWYSLLLFTGGNMLLWTYYGTNELLSGLHSYANSAGGAEFWDNFIHERNRWFVWTSGLMALTSLGLAVAYLLRRSKPGDTVTAQDLSA